VLLGALDDEQVSGIWETSDRTSVTERTVRTLDELIAKLEEVRAQGWALVDQELELGVRSIAAPIQNGAGEVVAAANVSTHASRTTKAVLLSKFLPELLRTAQDISRAVAVHPAGR
jgi:IclR family pca regulon transcriptional regulator